jgi:hypothetical protein
MHIVFSGIRWSFCGLEPCLETAFGNMGTGDLKAVLGLYMHWVA